MPLNKSAQNIFETFPHGILVFELSGELVAANSAAATFLGPLRRTADGRRPRCCDLFGCRTTGVLSDVCLSELAGQAAGPLPEIRVDLAAPAPVETVWLTTAPFGGEDDHFLVELRAAEAGDSRWRTQPQWIQAPRLHVFALGRTRIEGAEGPLEAKWLDQRTGQLLKYLVCERRRVVYPDEIAAAIWPHERAHAAGTLRYFVHRLRRELEPEAPPNGPWTLLIAAKGGYKLASSVQVDADRFERDARAGLSPRFQGQSQSSVGQLERAIALYRGDLMEELPNVTWVFEERERLRNLAEQALRHLVRMDLHRQDFQSALGRLRRAVQIQPFDVELHRQLLTLCLLCGRRSEAMRRYSVLTDKLQREFSEEPGFNLADLTSEGALRALYRAVAAESAHTKAE